MQSIIDEIRTFDQTFDEETVKLMLKTVLDEKVPSKSALITRYSPFNRDLQTAWNNFKLFFGNDGHPKTWFYPEMGREDSVALIYKSAYNELSPSQKFYVDSDEVKAMLARYEGHSKFFVVRHCVLRSDCFTVVRLERTRHWNGDILIDYSKHLFGINSENKFQMVSPDLGFQAGKPKFNTPDSYLETNFQSAGLSAVVVSHYTSQTRHYNN